MNATKQYFLEVKNEIHGTSDDSIQFVTLLEKY